MQARGAAADGNAVAGGRGAAEDVPLWRLYVLRACYAILAIGLGSSQMSAFLHHAHWTQNTAAAHSFLLALATLSVVGVRHPLRMLPLLVYELLWKMIWLVGVALPDRPGGGPFPRASLGLHVFELPEEARRPLALRRGASLRGWPHFEG
jgi:hypothetical protein